MHYKEKVFPAVKESTKSKHSKCNSARPNHLLLGDHLDEDEVERGKTRLVPGTRNYSWTLSRRVSFHEFPIFISNSWSDADFHNLYAFSPSPPLLALVTPLHIAQWLRRLSCRLKISRRAIFTAKYIAWSDATRDLLHRKGEKRPRQRRRRGWRRRSRHHDSTRARLASLE